ncbi:MAG TPA: NUDIX domain-containing protein [Candidatus Saccharimonadales bacterium]|nr:NUDIX domain-containing protein [Candidatus Saccharimonadales bacterium]
MKQSAGLLLFRKTNRVEVLLVHPGGPFWAKKDVGSWSIPKGEFLDDEEPQVAARREFSEELGVTAPEGELMELGSAKQSSGKVVYAWALEADLDTQHVKSNTFEMEWPPKSGQMQEFPEVDRAGWFSLTQASNKLAKGQVPLLQVLAEKLGITIEEEPDVDSMQTALL